MSTRSKIVKVLISNGKLTKNFVKENPDEIYEYLQEVEDYKPELIIENGFFLLKSKSGKPLDKNRMKNDFNNIMELLIKVPKSSKDAENFIQHLCDLELPITIIEFIMQIIAKDVAEIIKRDKIFNKEKNEIFFIHPEMEVIQ